MNNIYNGIHKRDLPIHIDTPQRYRYIHDEYSWSDYGIPQWARTYVRYRTFTGMSVGFYVTEPNRRLMNLIKKSEILARYKGSYEFRRTPVPKLWSGNYCSSKSGIGGSLLNEIRSDVYCEENNVRVRSKRSSHVKLAFDCDWGGRRYNNERCWKRTKKRKQWM